MFFEGEMLLSIYFKCCIVHLFIFKVYVYIHNQANQITMKTLLVMAGCCNNIIGCEQCVNTWYGISGSYEELMKKPWAICNVDSYIYSYMDMLRQVDYMDDFVTQVQCLLMSKTTQWIDNFLTIITYQITIYLKYKP